MSKALLGVEDGKFKIQIHLEGVQYQTWAELGLCIPSLPWYWLVEPYDPVPLVTVKWNPKFTEEEEISTYILKVTMERLKRHRLPLL